MGQKLLADYLITLPDPHSSQWNWETLVVMPSGEKIPLRQLAPDYVGIESKNRKNGTLFLYGYSLKKGGQFDQWVVCQGDPLKLVGGTNVSIWTRINGVLYILVLEQDRPLIDFEQKIWGPPGGFKEEDETYEQALVRQIRQKTGLLVSEESLSLLGEPVNMNRAFFYTKGKKGANSGGDRHYACFLPPEYFMLDDQKVWRIDPGHCQESIVDSDGRPICRLMPLLPLEQSLNNPDGVLVIGVSKLLTHLAKRREIVILDMKFVRTVFFLFLLFMFLLKLFRKK